MARATPNDRKLSDTPERRGTCEVGGKVVAEAGAVTRRRVRCSAWLGVAAHWEKAFELVGKKSIDERIEILFAVARAAMLSEAAFERKASLLQCA